MPLVDLSGAAYPRQIIPQSGAPIAAYLTIEEAHTDIAEITRHPVDKGAVMSDHIFFMQPEVRLRLGWSNSDNAADSPSYILRTYKMLLDLKNARQLFMLYTGKRLYNNMFVAELRGPTTDSHHEFSMVIDAVMRQILLVDLASPTTAPSSTTAAPSSATGGTASPQDSTPVQNGGVIQLQNGTATSASAGTAAGASSSASGVVTIAPHTNSDGGGISDQSTLDAAVVVPF